MKMFMVEYYMELSKIAGGDLGRPSLSRLDLVLLGREQVFIGWPALVPGTVAGQPSCTPGHEVLPILRIKLTHIVLRPARNWGQYQEDIFQQFSQS